jgi:L-ascorbate metabolism protein UlaG (beta-lactamase superfamily)
MDLTFHWIGGATFILTFDGLKIAIDPVLCPKGTIQDYFWFKSKRMEEPQYSKDDFKSINIWLLTHNHEDHLDDYGLAEISLDSYVVSNQNVLKKLQHKNLNKHSVLNWGKIKKYKINGYEIEIEAIPAIHGINPISAFFAGKVNGCFLTIYNKDKKIQIYITGDTVYKKWIVKKLIDRKIDLLIPNMGAAKQGSWIMTLTLNSKMLQKIIAKLNPKMVIPVHFGTFKHYKEPEEVIRKINDNRIKIINVGGKLNLKLSE